LLSYKAVFQQRGWESNPQSPAPQAGRFAGLRTTPSVQYDVRGSNPPGLLERQATSPEVERRIHPVSETGVEPASSGFRRRRAADCATRRTFAPSSTPCYHGFAAFFPTNQSSRAPGGSRTHLSTVAGWCLDRSATGASKSGRRGSRTLKGLRPRPGSNRAPSPFGLPLRSPSVHTVLYGAWGRL
jgi:hypothetical protein